MSTPYDDLPALLPAQPKTRLVTGMAGFIGSNLLETPLKLDQTVVGLDNVATGHRHDLDQVNIPVTPTQRARVRVIITRWMQRHRWASGRVGEHGLPPRYPTPCSL